MDLLPACMSVLHLCGVPTEAGTGVTNGCEPLCVLQEQLVLSSADSSSSQFLSFNVSLGNLIFCI